MDRSRKGSPASKVAVEYLGVSFAVLAFLLLFFWDLFTVKVGFLSGDHKVQHYPWMAYLAHELHAGHWPLWTNLIGCGFPIFAEGQIALLYPLNLLIYGLVPVDFNVAYNYSTILHYFLGGLFVYLYCRSLKISKFGSFLSCFIFLFGSAQGGYFYNMNSQKTVIWFPLILFLMEHFFRSRRYLSLLWIGILFGVQINAGYLQIAVYSILFAVFYFALRSIQENGSFRKQFSRVPALVWQVTLMILMAFLVALPQLAASWELSRFSSRMNLPESFAYVGSLPPQGILTLLFPFLDSYLGQEIYIGIFGLLLLIGACFAWRSWSKQIWALLWLAVFAFLVALGGFSPLYVAFIKLTHFHGFRVPAKVVFFFVFALLVMAGWGWDKLRDLENNEVARKASRIFLLVVSLAIIWALTGEYIVRAALPLLQQAGVWIIKKYFVGNAVHPFSYEVYLGKLENNLQGLISAVSLRSNIWMQFWLGLFFINLLLGIAIYRSHNKVRKFVLGLGLLVLSCDLYGYNYVNNIRSAWEPYASYLNSAKTVADHLKKGVGTSRLYEYQTDLMQSERFPLLYNLNMLYGLPDVGVYAPFALRTHRKHFEGLGASSDSLTVSLADPKRFESLRSVLNVANVGYLLGSSPPPGAGWAKRLEIGNYALYENQEVLPRAFWLPSSAAFSDLDNLKNVLKPIVFQEDGEERIRIATDSSEAGRAFLSDIYYPGWKVTIDQEPAQIVRANDIFRSVSVSPGKHTIEFRYDPFYKSLLWVPFAAILVLTAFSLVYLFRLGTIKANCYEK